MIVFIKLTDAGSSTGPFSLYSNTNGFIVPFETSVPKSLLLDGYLTTAPDGTIIIKIKSEDPLCGSELYINISTTTTTTTSSTTTTTSTTEDPCEGCPAEGEFAFYTCIDNYTYAVYHDGCCGYNYVPFAPGCV